MASTIRKTRSAAEPGVLGDPAWLGTICNAPNNAAKAKGASRASEIRGKPKSKPTATKATTPAASANGKPRPRRLSWT